MKARFLALALTALLAGRCSESTAQWTPLCGSGDGFVVAMADYRDTLFSSGFFNDLCGTPAAFVSGFHNGAWQSAGTGLPDAGHALRVIGGELYSVGYQRKADSNSVFRWNGRGFDRYGAAFYLGNAVPGTSRTANLYDLIDYKSSLVVSGEFDSVAGYRISGIARRMASGAWDSLGAGLSGSILSAPAIMYPHQMCLFGSDLVVGGAFMYAGGRLANGIARWDGTQWHPMGDGFDGPVYALAVLNGELYAGGQFGKSGTLNVGNLAKWNGSSWLSPGLSLQYSNTAIRAFVHSLLPAGNRLIIAGGFDRATLGTRSYRSSSILSFDGTGLDTLHGGIPNTEIEALAIYKGQLVAGGGGSSTSSYIGSYQLPTRIASPLKEDHFKIFSPAGSACIQITSAQPIDKIIVSDMTGRTLSSMSPGSGNCSIPVPTPGMYVVTVQAGGYRQQQKIVVI